MTRHHGRNSPPRFRRPLQVLVYLYRYAEDGQPVYLLLRRNPEPEGFWQGVTGAPEENEPLLAAAKREVEEETGYEKLRGLRPTGLEQTFLVDARWRSLYAPGTRQIRETTFAAQVDDREPRLSPEHSSYRWCSFEEAISLLKWPNNREALRHLHAQLAKQARKP